MQMQNIEFLLFTTEQNDNLEHIKSALTKNFIKLIDTMKLHGISSQKNNVLNIPLNEIESCRYRQYEMNRLNNLLSCLYQYKNEFIVEEKPESIKLLIDSVSVVTTELSKDLINGSYTVLLPKVKLLKQKRASLHQELKSFIPTLKGRVHEFADGGPAVDVNNHDVKFRFAEIVLIYDLDYLIRYHLTYDGSSHSEVERKQSYVGDAIYNGGNLE